MSVTKNPQLLIKLAKTDITANAIEVDVKGYAYAPADHRFAKHGALNAPAAAFGEEAVEAYTLTPSWKPVENADFYEIEFNGLNYTNIRDTALLFDGLVPENRVHLQGSRRQLRRGKRLDHRQRQDQEQSS